MKKFKVTVTVEADTKEKALEIVGYRIYVHRDINSIAQRVLSIDVEEIED